MILFPPRKREREETKQLEEVRPRRVQSPVSVPAPVQFFAELPTWPGRCTRDVLLLAHRPYLTFSWGEGEGGTETSVPVILHGEGGKLPGCLLSALSCSMGNKWKLRFESLSRKMFLTISA